MDDTCTAIHLEEIEDFHKHLNSIETAIQFTKKIQQENKLPIFLDIHLTKVNDGPDYLNISLLQEDSHR